MPRVQRVLQYETTLGRGGGAGDYTPDFRDVVSSLVSGFGAELALER